VAGSRTGRWLDEKTFVFNESVVANEEGLRQLEFVLSNLGIELISCHSPGWYDTTGHGNIGTSHMDMVMLTVDHGKVLLAPHLVNYGFVRELLRRGYEIIEARVEEYWDLALNGVTLSPGRVVTNAGSPTVLRTLEQHDVEVVQVDFSESHEFAIAACTAPPSSSCATSRTSASNSLLQARTVAARESTHTGAMRLSRSPCNSLLLGGS
jgi:N-dimethylarginine dimethylaminohydrolase